MDILAPTPESIARAALALKTGEVVAYPTETVYGFGVDPLSESALEKLFRVKQRDPAHPVLLVVASMSQLKALVSDVGPRASALAQAFWPGPLSMLFPPRSAVPASLRGPDGRICVRQTSSAVAASLCEAFGGAIVSTSANLSGQPPATRAPDVPTQGVALCIDGGTLPPGPVSTVIDPESGEILRLGAISRDAIGSMLR